MIRLSWTQGPEISTGICTKLLACKVSCLERRSWSQKYHDDADEFHTHRHERSQLYAA